MSKLSNFRRVPCFLMCVAMAGCGSSARSSHLEQAISDYHAGRHTLAHDRATTVMTRATGNLKYEASYVAGLSAYQLGNKSNAESRFLFASESSDQETSAKAKAMLAQMRWDQNRPRDAADLFAEASKNLTGDEARKSSEYARLASQQAGIASAHPMHATKAAAHSAVAINDDRFTLQAGAFREHSRAKRAAGDVARSVAGFNERDVKIVPHRDSHGRKLYLVQFGSFPTRHDAAKAREQIGRLEFIVAARTNSTS